MLCALIVAAPSGVSGYGVRPDAVAHRSVVPDGIWRIQSSDSIVGYRAREKYVTLPVPGEVVGRTSVVQGTMTTRHGTIVATKINVDMRTLKSNDSERDYQLRTVRGPRWDKHPHGSFALRRPIQLAGLGSGAVRRVAAEGILRVHDVSRRVAFALQVRWQPDKFEAAGNLRTKMTEFGFDPPSVAGFTKVSNAFTIEVKLTFIRLQ